MTLSHQKQMTLPIINPKDVSHNYLYKKARMLKIGGTNLDKVIMKAIHVDPLQRYQKIDNLRRDLVMALAKEAG